MYKKIKLLIILILILAVFFTTSCNGIETTIINDNSYVIRSTDSKINCSDITESQVLSLLNKNDCLYNYYIDYNTSQSKPAVLPTLSEINDVAEISELKEFEADNRQYLYNVYHYEDNISQYDFVILYDYMKDSGQAYLNSSYVIDRLYKYDDLDGNEDSTVNIFGESGYTEQYSMGDGTLMPTQLRMLSPQLLKENELVYENENGAEINPAFVYLTDKGFACVYYDKDYNFSGKFILQNPEIEQLYEQYVNYDTNVIS